MTPRYHMQDQVHDRIKDLMDENRTFPRLELLPNVVAPAVVALFLLLL